MTNKEALEVFRKRDVCYDNGCPDDMYTCVDCPNHYTEKEYSDAMDLAKKALEKQIPKKPNNCIWYSDGSAMGHCPMCDTLMDSDSDAHCCGCGQAIDWTEGE